MLRYLLCGAAIAGLMATPAAAQSASAPSSQAVDDATVSELIVTSRRREERVQDVPAAVSGISADQIRDLGGLRDIKDLSFLLPGIAFVDTGNINAENNIRGAGAGTARTAGVDAPIAVLRDGASITGGNIGGRTFTRGDLFDVSRVEVTRGPQGALYGVNAVGGVIQALTQRPKQTFGGSVGASWSPEIERRQVDVILNVPIPALNLGLRLGFQDVDRDDGFFYNVFTGRAGDVEKFRAARIGLEWTPTDALSVYMVLDQTDELSPSNQIKGVNAVNNLTLPATQFGPPDPDGPFRYAANGSNDVNRNVLNFNTTIELETPIGKLTSTTLVRNRATLFSQDPDGSAPGYSAPPFPLATCASRGCVTTFGDYTEIASQDVRLAGDLSDTLSFMVGANIQGIQNDFFTIVDGRTTSATNLNPSPTVNRSAVDNQEELQRGVFASLSWSATDDLTIDAAVRYNHSRKKDNAFAVPRMNGTVNCQVQYRDPQRVFATNPACILQRSLLDVTFTNTAPSISVKYELAPNWRVFASSGVGYRAGGFNTNSILDPAIAPSYTPEKSVAFELGTKWEMWGGFFTLTAFRNNFDDLLVTIATIGPDLVSRNSRFNAGKAETHGVDFEVFGARQFGPEQGSISYNAAINYLTGKIQEGPYDGRTVEGSPKWTVSAGLAYRRPLIDDWRLIAALSYRGQRGGFTNSARIDNATESADWDLFNGSIGVENGRWRATVDASNLFDKTYVSLRDATNDIYGNPREVRLSLSYAFGSEARGGR